MVDQQSIFYRLSISRRNTQNIEPETNAEVSSARPNMFKVHVGERQSENQKNYKNITHYSVRISAVLFSSNF